MLKILEAYGEKGATSREIMGQVDDVAQRRAYYHLKCMAALQQIDCKPEAASKRARKEWRFFAKKAWHWPEWGFLGG